MRSLQSGQVAVYAALSNVRTSAPVSESQSLWVKSLLENSVSVESLCVKSLLEKSASVESLFVKSLLENSASPRCY